ncbi:NADPH-dependent FMN reductase [Flavilitoribacter nigricans]|uniref:FMN reductase n=1 Tax=Flavilitoribacter nigricans (strain ATCC 23147 / DSM 23189 / NBRC 102662 / NCIMB 1420 / SS-2) TaxID=1122177 RepID=A0A2D0N8T7_FLAN2|nr:NAD(P)H-dependent oxidoreductase [Flavilitoribacter nigricans]PHN04808.1 FMN reductase [Flavilitoribacter nigricans DSM 23189 = NBRC 102662]
MKQKEIFALNGSASQNSSNFRLLQVIEAAMSEDYRFSIMEDLALLPHFQTELTDTNTPAAVTHFRQRIAEAAGVLICTPEYVFSIPSRLKNALEWCVSTTVFSDKPIGLITASASGVKGQEELKLIIKTIQGIYTEETTLLIQGVKAKIDRSGKLTDPRTEAALGRFITSFKDLVG